MQRVARKFHCGLKLFRLTDLSLRCGPLTLTRVILASIRSNVANIQFHFGEERRGRIGNEDISTRREKDEHEQTIEASNRITDLRSRSGDHALVRPVRRSRQKA